jgi:molybdenum cofactor cytidylyltransferase
MPPSASARPESRTGRVTGLVLAAGGSRRLGTPKQLLPYRSQPLLGHVLSVARQCQFDQLLCVIGGGADEVSARVEFAGVEVVENPEFGEGCASSIAAALEAVDPDSDLLLLMLGDQPGVRPETVGALLQGIGSAPLAVCGYEDGWGHPIAFARSTFADLAALHGDKGVWKLLDRRAAEVAEVRVPGLVPLDIDTWEDYDRVLALADTDS